MARNGHFGRLAKSAGFRRNPQEHAGTGAIRQEKTPTENGWGFVIGGDGGNCHSPVFRLYKGFEVIFQPSFQPSLKA